MGTLGKDVVQGIEVHHHHHLDSLLDMVINYHAPFSPEIMMIIIDHDSNICIE